MKRYTILLAVMLMFVATSCFDEFLDLDPLDQPTEAIYFTQPAHFKAGANDFYNKMIGFNVVDNSNIYDWTGYRLPTAAVTTTDVYWRNPYKYIRSNNYLIMKGEEYTGNKDEIRQYVAAAHFFRAWHYFFLLKRYGGVPIITSVPDVDSPELLLPRNTRYEVTEQILKDLAVAIDGLPLEKDILAADKGQVSKQAAKAFKARVLLYEATWEKYVGESTDFNPGQKTTDNFNAYLTESANLSYEVMTDATYELWNKVDSMSYYYLFVLEDAKSNPRGFTKTSNKEFILRRQYDKELSRTNNNLSHTLSGGGPDREMMDMFLCKDGLPYTHSPNAKGYNLMTDEFENRDWRLFSLVKTPKLKYWGWGAGTNGGGADYNKANYFDKTDWPTNYNYTFYPDLATGLKTGYINRKWVTENPGTETTYEAYDYPLIRLAEVYLNYAEAKCELGGGTISNADLDISINKVRARAGVAGLSNELIAPYSDLTLLGEIRRERYLELNMENFRVDDIKRWAIAEEESNKAILGMVVENPDDSPTEVATFVNGTVHLYNPAVYSYGVDETTGAVIVAPATNRFTRRDYLAPIPTNEIQQNPNLKQNPDWQ